MKWLIKPTKIESEKVSSIMKMLDVADIPFDIVHTVNGVMYDNQKNIYEMDLSVKNFVCGSYQLAFAAGLLQPSSAFLLDDYTFKDWYNIFGKENMLNPNVEFSKISEIDWKGQELFVRPLLDSKSFNGGIYSKDSLMGTIEKKDFEDFECLVAPLQSIQKEFRFFVLGGKIIGSSQYKMNGELFPSSIVDTNAIEFAMEMISKFDFPGFVIDIASNNGKCSVVELNCFNASGFYDIDLWKFVSGVIDYYENLKGE